MPDVVCGWLKAPLPLESEIITDSLPIPSRQHEQKDSLIPHLFVVVFYFLSK